MEQGEEKENRVGKQYHEHLHNIIDTYVHLVYKITKEFPKDELYGVTSQLRRSALSVMLNYVEGYARGRNKVHKNFLEISFGSLKESMYLLDFSMKEGFLSEENHHVAVQYGDEIGAMLWGILRKI